MKRSYLYMIIAVVVLLSAGYFILRSASEGDVQYRTERVNKGDVVVQVRATGVVNPVQTVQVGSQVSGTIANIYADFNSEVKKGQIVARIDSTFLYASVKEAEANLERNQAQVNEAKRSMERTQELFKKDLVSQADLDAAQTSYEAALAQLKQTQAALDRAKVNLRYSIIRSPIDGVVISRDVDVGQTVAASLQAPQLFKIANDLKHMQVEASVDEADIGQVRVGQNVTFTVDAYPDESFRGRVTQVRLAPVSVQNVVTYTVIIEVDNPDLKLRPGMTATVSVLVDRRSNVLRVPTLALRFQPPADVQEKFAQQQQPAPQQTSPADSAHGSPQRGETMRQTREGGSRAGMQTGMQGGAQGERRQWRRDETNPQLRSSSGRVWVLDSAKQLKPITVRTGLNDQRYVEIVGGELKEGDEIVIGSAGGTLAGGPTQSNPFQQRVLMAPGGGGGGRR
jgi:HlyD family secretion protein